MEINMLKFIFVQNFQINIYYDIYFFYIYFFFITLHKNFYYELSLKNLGKNNVQKDIQKKYI